MESAMFVLLGSILASCGYCVILQRLHDIYSPDHIWITVVIGNTFVVGSFALLAVLDLVPWVAVAWLVALNVAWGMPVIIWQLWQAVQRRRERGL